MTDVLVPAELTVVIPRFPVLHVTHMGTSSVIFLILPYLHDTLRVTTPTSYALKMETRPRGQVTRAQLRSLLGDLPSENLRESSHPQPLIDKGIDRGSLRGGASDTCDAGNLQVCPTYYRGCLQLVSNSVTLAASRLLRDDSVVLRGRPISLPAQTVHLDTVLWIGSVFPHCVPS